jgi:ribosomal protein L14
VCYQSLATNIIEGENENGQVIYCKDITVTGDIITEEPTLIIKPEPFNEQDKELGKPSLSADGKVLAFESNATIIANRPKNAYFQIYTYTFETQGLRLISSNASGFPAFGNSTSPSISGDGSSIGFNYNAQSLTAPADLKGLEGISSSVFVKHTVSSGVNAQVNTNASGTPSNGQVHNGRIDTKSQFAVFSDNGSNITTASDGIYFQVYLKSLTTGEVVRTSVTSANQAGNEDSGFNSNPAFAAPLAIGHTSTSQNSPFVSFISVASNLASIGAPDTTKPFVFRSLVVTPTPTATPTPTPTPTQTPTPTPRTLTNQIRISEPPSVTVLQKNSQGLYDIEIVCEKFALDPLKIKNYPELVELLASSKARLTYSIDIRKAGSSKRTTRVSTRNSVTVRKLTPGRYTIRYSVIATKGSKRIQSRMSPGASITLS